MIRRFFVFLLLVVGLSAGATVAVPAVSFVIHDAAARDSSVLIHASSITDRPIDYVRLQVNWLEPTPSGGLVVRRFRNNALCPCDDRCDRSVRVLRPWERADFTWDLRSD